MNAFLKLTSAKPIYRQQIEYRYKTYLVNYMPAELMRAACVSGYATNGQAYISDELTGPVKRFVTIHELYHLADRQHWLGYFGSELRANIVCGMRDPVGLIATVLRALKSGHSFLYFKRMVFNDTNRIK